MADFRELAKYYASNQEALSNSRVLLDYLADAMAPFKARNPIVEVSYNIDQRTYTLAVWVQNLPWFKFKHRFSSDALLSLYDPNIFFVEAGLAIREYWRDIPRVIPEDNIELGES